MTTQDEARDAAVVAAAWKTAGVRSLPPCSR